MVSVLVTATLSIILCSLWIRRGAWRSRWEVGANINIALQGCAIVTMSPWASAALGPHLYRIVGRWNVEDLLGGIFLIVAVMAIIHHGLTRLSHQDQVQALFRSQVLTPVLVGVPLLITTFAIADERYYHDLFPAPVTDIWLGAYWLVLGGLLIYLLTYAGRVLLILRQDGRATLTADLYLAAVALGVLAHALQIGTAWVGVNITLPVWSLLCAGAVGFAYGSARSWHAKISWFVRDPRSGPDPQFRPA